MKTRWNGGCHARLAISPTGSWTKYRSLFRFISWVCGLPRWSVGDKREADRELRRSPPALVGKDCLGAGQCRGDVAKESMPSPTRMGARRSPGSTEENAQAESPQLASHTMIPARRSGSIPRIRGAFGASATGSSAAGATDRRRFSTSTTSIVPPALI